MRSKCFKWFNETNLKFIINKHWDLNVSNGLLTKIMEFIINKYWDLNVSNGLLNKF